MKNGRQLPLERCPHCSVALPHLAVQWSGDSASHNQRIRRVWSLYQCMTCGGMILTAAPSGVQNPDVETIWPSAYEVEDVVPARARDYLSQAIASQHAPAGAVMLAASAVDAMLKDKGLKDGSLNSRIDAAVNSNLITHEMAAWAHDIRLDANDQRHADDAADLPTAFDAEKVIEFAKALVQFVYVLPARVARGRKA